MKVTVLGAGSWGSTVAAVMCRNSDVMLWAWREEAADEINAERRNSRYLGDLRLPASLVATADLEAAVVRADVLVMGVPTSGFRSTLVDARPYVRPWVPVVSLSKGLESGTLLRMSQIIEEVLPGHPAGALTGPNLAREVLSGQAAAAVIAMGDDHVALALQRLFKSGLFRTYVNEDVIGCETAAALKNVIVIATGMAQSLEAGDNTRALIITRGLAELTRLGTCLGGHPATFAGLAGMGDLLATCMSPLSRNRFVGEQLGLGRKLDDIIAEMNMVAEGVKTASLVLELAARYDLELPICESIAGVIRGDTTPAKAYAGLLRRRPGHERESD